jgi:hypothetical protein
MSNPQSPGRSSPGFWVLAALLSASGGATAAPKATYPETILGDKPAAYWRLNDESGKAIRNFAPGSNAEVLNGSASGRVALRQPAQENAAFPEFEPDSTSAAFGDKETGFIRVKDPGASSPLDFGKGDAVTLEAWVFLNQIKDGQQIYVVGKGRTGNKGFAADNQNYALRLRGEEGSARVSFLFRDALPVAGKTDSEKHWHRWTSFEGFLPNSGWHHVAVTYKFGSGASIRAYIDGLETKGLWDMGGQSDAAPVVDDDELWIGSSMGASKSSTFNGQINEVAIYRRALTAADLKKRFKYNPAGPSITVKELPRDAVRVELIENIPSRFSWNFQPPTATEIYAEPAFGFTSLPQKYSSRGLREDRSTPFLLRASSVVKLPKGDHRLLLRGLNSARLFVDGRMLAVTKFITPNGDGHGEVEEPPQNYPAGLRYPRMGHVEAWVNFDSDGKEHVFVLEAFIGGKGLRPEVGELTVSVARNGELFHLLAPKEKVLHTDESWTAYINGRLDRLAKLDAQHRKEAAGEEEKYWVKRHQLARRIAATLPTITVPQASATLPMNNDIDRFINTRLEAAKLKPEPLVDDFSFLRRLALDTTGTPPAPEQIQAFLKDDAKTRRARAIDTFLAQPGWADHWVSYWQDVLAENPAILKPTLNNTGPFRWWIHEAFTDNKPMDRFASELVSLRGSVYGGGPAGFGLATQNDVPMADRAQVLSSAFLGMNLACARCHDAPYHDFKQKDLFSLAAMLNKGPQEVPKSSSIPANANITVGRRIKVTLHPGEKVEPAWPFEQVLAKTQDAATTQRTTGDTREQLAAFITDPANPRFAKVIANRLWKRYLGWGLVEPVEDWEFAKPSHPELLEWLGRELVTHDYDLKHVARLILNSQIYQRVAVAGIRSTEKFDERLFASPSRRRLTAEQFVDSLFAITGKSFDTEPLTFDQDGRRAPKDFLNLGVPRRAWEFSGFANDRDRPALAMPKAQAIADVMGMFGWRDSRQNALSVRDDSANVLQPAAVANGDMANGRITRLSDCNTLTALCLEDKKLPELVETVFLRVYSREPTAEEKTGLVSHLERGYSERVVPRKTKPLAKEFDPGLLLSWSNHLNAKATDIKMAADKKARQGDEPTDRLRTDWRQRMEDALWAMVNSPEFVFVP